MTVLCLGALLAGMTAASLLPFLPFAGALLTATVLGSAWSVATGGGFGRTAGSAFALLFSCQIGYGLGVAAVAAFGQRVARRRVREDEQASASAQQLRTGNGPR